MFDLMPLSRSERAFLNSIFSDSRDYLTNSEEQNFALKVDVEDKGDHFELTADLPGFKKEDVHIDIENKIMSIEAKHSEEKEEKNKNYVYRERVYGSYSRSFDMTGIRTEDIAGSFENGVLKVILPKKEKEENGRRRLELSGDRGRESIEAKND